MISIKGGRGLHWAKCQQHGALTLVVSLYEASKAADLHARWHYWDDRLGRDRRVRS